MSCGARAFDLRPVCKASGEIVFHHGFVTISEVELETGVREIVDFLAASAGSDEHGAAPRSDVALLYFNKFHAAAGSADCSARVAARLESLFGIRLLSCNPKTEPQLSRPTLSDSSLEDLADLEDAAASRVWQIVNSLRRRLLGERTETGSDTEPAAGTGSTNPSGPFLDVGTSVDTLVHTYGNVLAVDESCVDENYDPSIHCEDWVDPVLASSGGFLGAKSQERDLTSLEEVLPSSAVASLGYDCWSPPERPLDPSDSASGATSPFAAFFRYWRRTFDLPQPRNRLRMLQAHWQYGAGPISYGEVHGSSILRDAERSHLNSLSAQALRKAHSTGGWSIFEVDDVCLGGTDLVEALEGLGGPEEGPEQEGHDAQVAIFD